MNFNDYVELDTSSNAILIKSFSQNNNEIVIKVNEKETKEIKLKKNLIQFFTSISDFSNPLAPEFTIEIYFNNHIVSIEVTRENKEEIEKFYEYIKSILL